MVKATEIKTVDEVIGEIVHHEHFWSASHGDQTIQIGGRPVNRSYPYGDGTMYEIIGDTEEDNRSIIHHVCDGPDCYCGGGDWNSKSNWYSIDEDYCWDQIDPDDYPKPC